jgi:hypothetical protein
MGKARPVFHEEQAFRQRHARVALATPPAAILFITLRQLVWHRPWGHPPTSNGDLLFLSVLLVTVRLVTDLRSTEIAVRLRGLWRKRETPLDQVCSAKVVEYDRSATLAATVSAPVRAARVERYPGSNTAIVTTRRSTPCGGVSIGYHKGLQGLKLPGCKPCGLSD